MRAWWIGLVSMAPAVAGPAGGDGVPLTRAELSRVDVRGTASAIGQILAEVEALPRARREAASASLQFLTSNDPYTRLALQVPVALHAEVAQIPADSLPPFVQQDWIYLQEGLDRHLAVLDRLQVTLALPSPHDALIGAPGLVDRATLDGLDDPIATTQAWVAEVPALLHDLDPDIRARIAAHSDRVEAATSVGRPCAPWAVMPNQPWTLGMQLAGWHDALRRIEPFLDDPAHQHMVERMQDLLEGYGEAGFIMAPAP